MNTDEKAICEGIDTIVVKRSKEKQNEQVKNLRNLGK